MKLDIWSENDPVVEEEWNIWFNKSHGSYDLIANQI